MAAFLLLPTGADLTLADVETWVARARTLGASDSSPVQVGTPPLAPDNSAEVALSVPVTVSRTILPGAAPAAPTADSGLDVDESGSTAADAGLDVEESSPTAADSGTGPAVLSVGDSGPALAS
jgi:hypothetical protein